VSLEDHRTFLDGYYRWVKPVYDATRKYYLRGRDRTLAALARESWTGLVEVGPGTGRNLQVLARMRPDAVLGGVEASDEMLDYARARLPQVQWLRGFAETASYTDLLGRPIDRVLFSYSLSMMQRPAEALDRALCALGPGGCVVVVDFADLGGLPAPLARALQSWLGWFHVRPLDPTLLLARGAQITYGPGRYYLTARLTRAAFGTR
jgi:S-adenosylmethionine-diacylgycerolhomoserine-N-methlytransferase